MSPFEDVSSSTVDLTGTDALRSLKRYVAVLLGEEWEVRLTFEEGSFERPYAMVARAGPTLYSGGSPLFDVLCPFVVQAYPAVGGSMDESLMNAEAAQELLFLGLGRGVDLGHPFRIPFYDYQGVALDQPVPEPVPHRFMRVEDLNIETSAEPEDYRLYIVHADVRVSWRRVGDGDPAGPDVTAVGVTFSA